MISALSASGLMALGIITIFAGLMRLLEPEMSLRERLDIDVELGLQTTPIAPRPTPASSRRADESTRGRWLLALLERLIARRGIGDQLTRQLLQADLQMTASEYLLVRGALVCLAFLLGIGITRDPVASLLLAGAGLLAPRFFLRRRRRKRLEAFEDQLGDVLMLLIGALQAGYGLLHALPVVVDELPPPASTEFQRVIQEVGLGLTLQEALANLVRRVKSDDLEMIVTAINIQQEIGGNLATILDTISETIQERVQMDAEIRVLTAQQKLTGYILAGLPFVLASLLFLVNPDYMKGLFRPGLPLLIPGVAIFGILLGFLMIRRIVTIEV